MPGIFVVDFESFCSPDCRQRPKENADVPTQFLSDARLLSPKIQMGSYAATMAGAQDMRGGTSQSSFEWPAEAIVNLRLLAKGVGWALAIEGAMALGVCAVWYLCHLRF